MPTSLLRLFREINIPPVESTIAAKLPFTFDIHISPSEFNTPPITLPMGGGQGVGSSAHSDPTIVALETQEAFTPALVAATTFVAPISFEFVTTGGVTATGGGYESNTLDEGGRRPSKDVNAVVLPIFCPEGNLVAQLYDPFSFRGNVNRPSMR